MYIEASGLLRYDDNAKLELSVSGNGELSCLQFYYHMYGDTIGTLNVFSGNLLIFNASGNYGDYWLKARRTIALKNTVSLEFLLLSDRSLEERVLMNMKNVPPGISKIRP